MTIKVRDVLKRLKKDGWILDTVEGSHRQFEHPTKPGKVTVNGHLSDDLGNDLIKSIEKQSGLKF